MNERFNFKFGNYKTTGRKYRGMFHDLVLDNNFGGYHSKTQATNEKKCKLCQTKKLCHSNGSED